MSRSFFLKRASTDSQPTTASAPNCTVGRLSWLVQRVTSSSRQPRAFYLRVLVLFLYFFFRLPVCTEGWQRVKPTLEQKNLFWVCTASTLLGLQATSRYNVEAAWNKMAADSIYGWRMKTTFYILHISKHILCSTTYSLVGFWAALGKEKILLPTQQTGQGVPVAIHCQLKWQ